MRPLSIATAALSIDERPGANPPFKSEETSAHRFWSPSESEGESQEANSASSAYASTVGNACDMSACNTPAAAVPSAAPAAADRGASYSACSYWDGRYAQRATHFDWFFSYSALKPLLRDAMTLPKLPVLHVGCGNSDLSVGIGEDGTQVVNTDISPVVINQMRADAALWPDCPARRNCSWEVADCRSMPQFGDDAFGAVLEKGTLDAVLCSGTGLGDVRCYVSEAHRVLAPGGVLLLVSLGQPECRLSVLRAQPRLRRPSSADGAVSGPQPSAIAAAASAPTLSARLAARVAAAAESAAASPAALTCAGAGRREVRWARALVYFLPKPSLYLQSEAAIAGRRLPSGPGGAVAAPRLPVGKDEPVSWLGPYEVGRELEDALAAPGFDPRDYFYMYACVKAGAPSARRASVLAREQAAADTEALAPVARSLSIASGLGDLAPLGQAACADDCAAA